MRYDASTPNEYLDQLEDDWRKTKLQELRAVIQTEAPKLKEGINYRMLSYGDEKGVVFHLTAQRQYVSLYVGDANKVDPDGSLLADIDVGKGCIRFKKSVDVDKTRIADFIKRSIELWDEGADIDC